MRKGPAILTSGVLLMALVAPPRACPEDAQPQARRAVVHRVQPIYPELARRLRLEGAVVVKAEVASDGHVRSVTVVSGNSILAQAAITAVRYWTFAGGADETIAVDINFNLAEGRPDR